MPRIATGIAVGFVAATLVGCTSSGHPKPSASAGTSQAKSSSASTPSSPTATTPTLTAPQATALARALTTTDRQQAVAVLAPAVAAQYRQHPGRFWPAGTTLHIDWQHLSALSAAVATVPATTTGSVRGRWTIVLVNTSGRWTVLSTAKTK